MQLVQVKQQEAQRQIENTLAQNKFNEDTRQFNETLSFNQSKSSGTDGSGAIPLIPTPSPKPTSKPNKPSGGDLNLAGALGIGGNSTKAKLLPPAMSAKMGATATVNGVTWTMTSNGWQ